MLLLQVQPPVVRTQLGDGKPVVGLSLSREMANDVRLAAWPCILCVLHAGRHISSYSCKLQAYRTMC